MGVCTIMRHMSNVARVRVRLGRKGRSGRHWGRGAGSQLPRARLSRQEGSLTPFMEAEAPDGRQVSHGLGRCEASAVGGLGRGCLSSHQVACPFSTPAPRPTQQAPPKYPPCPYADHPLGPGPRPRLDRVSTRPHPQPWPACPRAQTRRPDQGAWPGHSPSAPPAQTTLGKHLAALGPQP